MTNKEAIEILTELINNLEAEYILNDSELSALWMAHVALEQVTFQDLTKPNNDLLVLKEHHKVCDDCDGFIYDYCSECPIRNKTKDDSSTI